ncbi:hypothetical protein VI03_24960 [Burkholderia vietnamiensis]|uniref:SET domain-containing protein n=1 Tax=Burkholderia vietnamiensis TaxID=60552 RepID=UPI00062119FF|nr:SET domain-containing protein-lysine N-methyltransferase [Burkholderia vietnamiensis]KKI36032.1 hypothetical protein VI03_24960 [Burkholderia vietnamiensis]HDR9174419.1 SET domain-containing protein-lysine N-methyltransferase [Burkholderia vietnamiensis]
MRRFTVRRSPVHGNGVFALCPLHAGEMLVEYKGKIVDWSQAVRAHRRAGREGHTFLFGLSDGRVIDGAQGGNSARWINHACDANCQAVEIEDRVFIEVLRNIGPGEEIFIDYGLQVEESVTDDMRREYACHCGSGACRGTMLSDAHRAT